MLRMLAITWSKDELAGLSHLQPCFLGNYHIGYKLKLQKNSAVFDVFFCPHFNFLIPAEFAKGKYITYIPSSRYTTCLFYFFEEVFQQESSDFKDYFQYLSY